MRTVSTRFAIAATVLALAVAAVGCSSSDDGSAAAKGTDPSSDTNDVGADDEDDAGDAGSASGGRATITIGDRTWNFDRVRCAFGEDEIGAAGAELVVAASDGSISLYVSVEEDLSYIELTDLESTDGEGVTWTTQGVGAADPEISVSGGSVSSDATFVSYGDVDSEDTDGSFEATCP